jgi:RNA polymerase sigma factor (sigma-70 family)
VTAAPLDDPEERPPRRADSGEETRAIERFYRERYPDLVAFVMWHGASSADARDCAHEAMTEAIGRWSDLSHPYSWCRTVASRAYLRRAREQGRWAHDAVGTPAEPAAPDVLDEVEQRHHLLTMIKKHLTPAQAQVIAFHYDGTPTEQIAEALDISCAAVRGRLRDARAALRAARDHEEEHHAL